MGKVSYLIILFSIINFFFQGISTDERVELLMKIADEIGEIYVSFHLEPYEDRNISMVRDDIVYIFEKYSKYKSFYRDSKTYKPIFYCYDSYKISSSQWKSLLSVEGSMSLRNTSYDSVFIGLILRNRFF